MAYRSWSFGTSNRLATVLFRDAQRNVIRDSISGCFTVAVWGSQCPCSWLSLNSVVKTRSPRESIASSFSTASSFSAHRSRPRNHRQCNEAWHLSRARLADQSATPDNCSLPSARNLLVGTRLEIPIRVPKDRSTRDVPSAATSDSGLLLRFLHGASKLECVQRCAN